MPTLTPLTAAHGFVAGDLDTTGQVALCPAYQRIYFADGRSYDADITKSGYHKLDFLNDKLTGTASAPLNTTYNVLTQAHAFTGSGGGDFAVGETVTQATSGATGIIAAVTAGTMDVLPVSGVFTTTNNLAHEGHTFTTSGGILSGAAGIFYESFGSGATATHLVYRTTETPFNATNVIYDNTPTTRLTLTPDGTTGPIYPPHWLNWTLTAGDFPDGGSDILALAFGRIFMNSKWHPHQWFATRINDPLDLELVVDDVASACNSKTASQAGLVGDQIVAIIPNKDLFIVFGCVNKMYLLRSDPLRGGFFTTLSDSTGIFSSTSYCWDDKYNLYFIGNDGIYTIPYEALINSLPATNLTKERVPKLLSLIGLNRGTDRATMVYDKDRYGLQITVSQKDGAWHTALWLDLRTGGIFPEKYAAGQIPASSFYFDSRTSAERACLVGGYDGYIRRYDEATKSDIAADDSDVAIDSYVTVGPITAQNTRGKITLSELSVRTGMDTDRLSIGLYSAITAAKLIDDLKAGIAPKTFKTFTLDSLLPSLRQKLSDGAVAVVISNNTVDSSFSMEKIDADISEIGRVK